MTFKLRFLSAAVLLVMLLTLCSCAVRVDPPKMLSSDDEAAIMSFSKVKNYENQIAVGEYTNLTVNISQLYRDHLTWESSDETIATVDANGRVDGKKEGKVVISAVAKGATIGYDMEVTKAPSKTISYSNAITDNATIIKRNAQDETGMQLYRIIINKANCSMTVFTYHTNGIYNVPVRSMVCGVASDIEEVTTEISDRKEWEEIDGDFYRYTSWLGDVPVRSAPYSKKAASTLDVDTFNKIGTPDIEKGIILYLADAEWIYQNCAKGTQVRIVDSEEYKSYSPLGVPKPMNIAVKAEGKNWDPSDSHVKNPYKHVINGAEDKTIKVGDDVNLIQNITGVDGLGAEATEKLSVIGSVDRNRPGKYVVSYLLTDTVGRSNRKDITITVEK